MSDARRRWKDFLNEQASIRLRQLGHSDAMISDAKREAWWWLQARGLAMAKRRGLLSGSAVVWTAPGLAELVSVEVPRARKGEVTVEVITSIVSTGTERAQYLRLPNTGVAFPHRPGYSAAGVVIAVDAIENFEPGDLVAVRNVPHMSVVTTRANSAHRVPPGLPPEAAAMVQLGVICGQGVRRADLEAGEPVCVVGAGLIGILAGRLAASSGAGPVTAIARTRAKEGIARATGAVRFLVPDEDADEIEALAARVVIEATGDPDALALAVAAAGDGGRVVLLGSPRGVTVDVPLAAVRAKRLRVIGAHVDTLRYESELCGVDMFERQAQNFLGLLASDRVRVTDLVRTIVDPREAASFYRRLAHARDIVGARFDWTLLPPEERVAKGRLWRVPDLRGRGVDFRRKPLQPRGSRGRHTSTTPQDRLPEGPDGRLRVGLLGCGDVGVLNAEAIHAAQNVDLVACYDPHRDLADDLARAYGLVATPTSDALLARDDVDAVLLSVPHHLHAPLGAEAADAGKHVIVEKPLANNLAAAVELVRAADAKRVALSVCFPHRYEPNVVEAKRLIAEGVLGTFAGATLTFFMDKPPSYWLGGFSGRAHSYWRRSRQQAGGGVLIMNLCHYIDLLRYLTGAEAESVTARVEVLGAESEVEDVVSVIVEYAGGALGSLFSCAALPGANSETELRLWGYEGQIAVEPDPRVYTLRAVEGLRTNRWQTFGRLPQANSRAVYFSRLATALARGLSPDVTATDGLAVQAFIEAAYQSSEAKHSVSPAELLAEAWT